MALSAARSPRGVEHRPATAWQNFAVRVVRRLQEGEVVEHARPRPPDLAGHLHERRLLVGALRTSRRSSAVERLHAVEAAQEVDVPPVAPELAVGDRPKPDRLLERHRRRGSTASSIARSAARSISPRAARPRASRSSGGRRRLPTWSARNGGLAAMLIAPSRYHARRVRRAARIGAGREHARLRIAARHHRADAAGADLGHRVPERSELGAGALGNARLDVELTGPVDARIERVDERLASRSAAPRPPAADSSRRPADSGRAAGRPAPGRRPRAADGHGGHAALADQVAHERGRAAACPGRARSGDRPPGRTSRSAC